jgi:hypothetical protein
LFNRHQLSVEQKQQEFLLVAQFIYIFSTFGFQQRLQDGC